MSAKEVERELERQRQGWIDCIAAKSALTDQARKLAEAAHAVLDEYLWEHGAEKRVETLLALRTALADYEQSLTAEERRRG